eukprot:8584140-Alexandrium_andersonii.AAC.1
MAEPPRGRGWTPSTMAHRGPLRAGPKRAPCCGRRCLFTATWGAALRRPKSLCRSAVAHSTAPIWGRL